MSESCLKFTTVQLSEGMRTSSTHYIRGNNTRTEYSNGGVFIENRDLGRGFCIDSDAHVYTACRIGRRKRPLKRKSSRYVTRIESETSDTGERREMFGYTARHVISRTVTTPDARKGEHPSRLETDGWYIDPPAAWRKLHPPAAGARFYVGFSHSESGVDQFKVSHTGPHEAGFPLVTVTVSRSMFRDSDGRFQERTSTGSSEVVEFSEEDLDPALFLPPHGFRRVRHLPGDYRPPLMSRLRRRWEIIRDLGVGV